jgi:two-component system, cell cycle sensor histidine kinase PleC
MTETQVEGPMKLASYLIPTFPDRAAEQRYQADHLARWRPFNRLAIALGVVFYGGFALVDGYVAGSELPVVLAIRLGLVTPLLALIFALTFVRRPAVSHQLLLSLMMASAGGSIVIFVALIGSPGNYLYSFGVDIVIIFCAILTSLRYVYLAPVGLALTLAYQVAIFVFNPLPIAAVITLEAFLVVSLAISVLGSYIQEFYARQSFAHTQRFEEEIGRSRELLAEANAANLAKSTFLANMSHELRTPLNAIIGFSDIIAEQRFGQQAAERYRSYAADINTSGAHLLKLVNDILDLAKSAAGRLELAEAPFDLAALVRLCVGLVAPPARQKRLEIVTEVSDELSVVIGDEARLRQVLLNLLSNAVKFSHERGRIAVAAALGPTRDIVVTIADDGIGMKAEDIPIALQPFRQIDGSLTRSYDGTGLGLPLATMLITMHGGTLAIASAPDLGTTVTLTLPSHRLALGARSAMPMATVGPLLGSDFAGGRRRHPGN